MIDWAFMYDGQKSYFYVFRGGQVLLTVDMTMDELPKNPNWLTTFGALYT